MLIKGGIMSKMIYKLIAVSFIAFIGVLLISSECHAKNYYGAFAYSDKTGGYGYSIDYSTRYSAEKKAINVCKKKTGDRGCKVLVWVKNACSALALGSNLTAGTGWGNNKTLAKRHALNSCRKYKGKNCKIEKWFCTARW